MEFPQRELNISCRVCGCKTGNSQKYVYKTTTTHVAQKLLVAYGLSVDQDYENVHPRNICVNCYVKSQKACNDIHYKCSNRPVVWLPHKAKDCETCDVFVKRNRGGKKARERKGRGRPGKGSKRGDSISTCQKEANNIPAEIIPALLINPMPSIERFSNNISEELVCPICREVLDRPLQGVCDHFFCYSCIENWLNYAGEGAGCPVCKREVKSKELRKPPRLLLNLLLTSGVECAVCKSLIKLEQLAQHEATYTSYVTGRCTTLISDILKNPLSAPLSQDEETLTTHLMKRKLAASGSPTVALRTGGTPLQVSILQRPKIGSSFASKRTIQRRAKVLQECRETVSGGGSENVFKQQQKEIQMLENDKQQQILREAGIKLEVGADEGLAMKSELGIP